MRIAELEFGAIAPRQELRIVLDAIDEVEHLLCGTLDQDRFSTSHRP